MVETATRFQCPNCQAQYKVVGVEAPPTYDQPLLCLSCGGSLRQRAIQPQLRLHQFSAVTCTCQMRHRHAVHSDSWRVRLLPLFATKSRAEARQSWTKNLNLSLITTMNEILIGFVFRPLGPREEPRPNLLSPRDPKYSSPSPGRVVAKNFVFLSCSRLLWDLPTAFAILST